MKRISISDPQAREHIETVAADGDCMPVRRLESLLDMGEPGMGMIVAAMRLALERRRALPMQWCAAALGRHGDPAVVPDLTHLLRVAWRSHAFGLGFAAAEAIGRLGSAAEPMLLQHAALTPRSERFWFLYAAARVGTDGAAAFLASELERNVPLADVAAGALADMGRSDVLPAIDRIMPRVAPWQGAGLEAAVLALDSRRPMLGRYTEDWRLRYRYTRGLGHFPSAWPCLSAMLRTHPNGRKAAAEGFVRRSSASIIAAKARSRGTPDTCRACRTGQPRAHTGVAVCDACAPDVARLQAECLLEVESRSNDIFDLLDAIDLFFMNRDRVGLTHDDTYRRRALAHAACTWLVEQGIESAAAGAAALLAEADVCEPDVCSGRVN